MKTNVGVIIDSGAALDCYRNATGQLPPPIPTGCNTVYKQFAADGHAALIVKQKGFALEPGEKDDDANGYMVYVVQDDEMPVEEGWKIIDQLLDQMKIEHYNEEQIKNAQTKTHIRRTPEGPLGRWQESPGRIAC